MGQCEVPGHKVVPQLRSQKEDKFQVIVFGWEKPGVGKRAWFSAHQVMDDVGQCPDNRNAEEGDAE